ncbi:G2/mitotic-specific cyclin-A-like [Lytechinus variegatus]|uniref:G2/mitotic-specific cyclin-A-like n=1 Tax=Lytechinus variegatus TaxID=7654 RepID=UPI001BB13D0D|nr:G2/mitotic-specific cyclin-A-like [Lytechinus variegatus]
MAFSIGSSNSDMTNMAQGGQQFGGRKTKRDDIASRNGPQACKRAALGTITNTSSTRVQPARAAKQFRVSGENSFPVFQDENAHSRLQQGKSFVIPSAAAAPAFSIHVDTTSAYVQPPTTSTSCKSTDKENEHILLDTALSLPVPPQAQRIPLRSSGPDVEDNNVSLIEETSSEYSPMLLDTSLDAKCISPQTLVAERDLSLGEPEYSEEIYQYLKMAELKHRPKHGYMRKQPDITNNMRCILVDWLVEVSEEYRLHNQTLYLATAFIDRFLSQMSVLRAKLQLVGTASMFVASKYEEIYPPDVKEFVYITDDTYSIKQVLRMEHLILKVLSFDLAGPTINCFLPRFLKAAQANSKTEHLTQYLAELTLQEYDFIKYVPSMIAASAVCLANHTVNNEGWTPTMAHYTDYQLSDIYPCLQDLHQLFIKAPTMDQQAVREKYKSQKYSGVSTTPVPTTLPTL